MVILFDLDGTLIDSLLDMTNAINLSLRKINIDKEISADVVEGFVGDGAVALIDRTCKYLDIEGNAAKELYEVYLKTYQENLTVSTTIYPYVRETLEKLKEYATLGVISNKPDSLTVSLVNSLFPNIFKIIRGQRKGILPKPDRMVFDDIVKEINILDKDIYYVGDMDKDEMFARAIGAKFIYASYGYGNLENCLSIDKFSKLLEVINND